MRGVTKSPDQEQKNHKEALKLVQELGFLSEKDVESSQRLASEKAKASKGELSGRVLIVDDSVTMREELRYYAERFGVSATLAADGQEAIKILKSGESFHLVLSDLNMPKMSGLQLMEQISKDNTLAKVPFIMITTESGIDDIRKAKSLGALGWLLKPTSMEAIGSVLKRFCPAKKDPS